MVPPPLSLWNGLANAERNLPLSAYADGGRLRERVAFDGRLFSQDRGQDGLTGERRHESVPEQPCDSRRGVRLRRVENWYTRVGRLRERERELGAT